MTLELENYLITDIINLCVFPNPSFIKVFNICHGKSGYSTYIICNYKSAINFDDLYICA